MRCEFLGKKGTWREVANSANTTIGLEAGDKKNLLLFGRKEYF
jgi:hypothetical protein